MYRSDSPKTKLPVRLSQSDRDRVRTPPRPVIYSCCGDHDDGDGSEDGDDSIAASLRASYPSGLLGA